MDDGSTDVHKSVFKTLGGFPECEIFVHAVNLGKGRALKDAFNYYLNYFSTEYRGVITADSDGQHTVEDILKLDHLLGQYPDSLILGSRDFSFPSVPLKSRFGNKLTRMVMKILIGGGISDTQTGLRAIPNCLLPSQLTLYGERFEYETNVLIDVLHKGIPIQEETIQTVYIQKNKGTHFRPVADSIAIYRLILSSFMKYTFASLSSFLLDYGVFCFVAFLLKNLPSGSRSWFSTLVARSISSLYNYGMNKVFVFQYHGNGHKAFARYYLLCVLQMCASALLVWLLCTNMQIREGIGKPFVDLILFFISYQIQRTWIFREAKA